jgi:hypothetical protein
VKLKLRSVQGSKRFKPHVLLVLVTLLRGSDIDIDLFQVPTTGLSNLLSR